MDIGLLVAVRIHTTKEPLCHDDAVERFGVRVTSAARTIADVADVGADPSVVIEAVADALSTGLVTPNELLGSVAHRSKRVRQLIDRAIKEAGSRAPVR